MSTLKTFVAALTMLMLFGCASTPKFQNMIYSGKVSGKFNKFLVNEICVAGTTRGRHLSADKKFETSTEAFEAALKESLHAHGLFSDTGRFQLKAHILKILQPPGNFDMKVTTHVRYTLVDSTTDKIMFKETVISDYTAYSTDALMSDKRHRLANEGSGKTNIAQFLNQLSQL